MAAGFSNALRLVLFGPPGVGKGTQAGALQARLKVSHISTGDMLRAAIRDGSALGVQAREIVDRGGLVPDALIGALIEERLRKPEARDGFILDGFPRTVAQAEFLEWVLRDLGVGLDGVINLAVPEAEIAERLAGRRVCVRCGAVFHVRFQAPRREGICDACGAELSQRQDDRLEIVAGRLRVYGEQTEPVLAWYRMRDALIEIDGRGEPVLVTGRIETALGARKG